MINPSDHSIRERVIKEVDRTLSVFAGAGTGKTTLLTKRYLSLLQKKQVSPKQIVAITFTIKAAAELRERILLGLQKENLSHLTAQVETSPIGTIHSFCSNILRQFALEANLDPQFAVISELEHRTFLSEIFQSWFNHSLAQHGHIFKTARSIGFSIAKIRTLALRLYDYRDLLDQIKIDVEKMDSRTIYPFIDKLHELYRFTMSGIKDQEDKGFQLMHGLYRSWKDMKNESEEIMVSAILREEMPKVAPGAQGNWDSANHCKEFKARYVALRESFIQIQRMYTKNLFAELIDWVKGYVAQVEQEKQNRSVLDFADLLLLTRNLLRNNPSVREQLQEQYHYFLIDEFQDTDPMQAEIFWTLARDEKKSDSKKPWHDQPLIEGKLFTVGDLNQSIYRFRDASVETYQRTIQNIQTQGELLYILHNFRSHPTIIDTVNEFFTSVLPENFKPLLTHEITEKEPAVHSLEMKEFDRKDDSRAFEAHSIAAHIRYLIDSKKQILDPITKVQRGINYKDVAMLFPALTSLSVYERAFREHGIPFIVYKGGAFFDTPEIHSVVVTLASLLYPFDKLSVPSALSSAWFGCSLDDLAEIQKEFKTFDYRQMDLTKVRDSVHRPLEILKTLHKDILTKTPIQFVDQFVELTQAFAHAEFRVNASQVKENLKKMNWLAHEFETTHSQNIGEFYEWLSHLSEQSRETPEATPSSESNAVQMMTIHTSKGLEFPVVFLVNFVSKIQEGSSVYANRFAQKLEIRMGDKDTMFKTEGFDDLAEQEKNLFMEEKKRLMYVAMTRARDIIVIPSTLEASGYQELLEPLMEQAHKFKTFNYSEAKINPLLSLQPEKQMSTIVDTSFLTLIPKGLLRTTATEEKEVGLSTQSKKYAFIQKPKLGIAFHAYVERSTKSNVQDSLIQQIVIENGIENQKGELQQMVSTYLNSDLHHRIQKSKQTLKEIPFSYFQDGILFEGYIDLMFEEPEGWVIVDLKTDQVTKDTAQERANFYRDQLDIYAYALKNRNMNVKSRVLYFAKLDLIVEL